VVDLVHGESLLASGAATPSFQQWGYRGSSLITTTSGVQLSAAVASSVAFSYCLWFYVNAQKAGSTPASLIGGGSDGGNDVLCLGLSQLGIFFMGRGETACTCNPLGTCSVEAAFNAPGFQSEGSYNGIAGNQAIWSHACFVYGDQTASIYINGTLASTASVDFDSAPTGSTLYVAQNGGPSSPFNGAIQGVVAFDVALNGGQVRSIWYNQVSGQAAVEDYTTYTNFSCATPTIDTPSVPVFLTGATTIPPPPSVTYPTRTAGSFGRTFYVSQSTGSDSNSGLSTTSPWQTLAPVNTLLGSSSQPGDSILLCEGDSYWVPKSPNGIVVQNIGTLGSPTMPITIASWPCRPGTNKKPLISSASVLPQSTGNIGWYQASWTYANGSESTSVLAYNINDLISAGGSQFILTNTIDLVNGNQVTGKIWVNGTEYIQAVHPNWNNFNQRLGSAKNEFVWYDAFAAYTPSGSNSASFTASDFYAISGGSFCDAFFYRLYGGNQELFAAGAGSSGYYVGTNYVGQKNDFNYNAAGGVPVTTWTPPSWSCAQWEQEYITNGGYTFATSDPWTYTIPFAQSNTDTHFTDPSWQPPIMAPSLGDACGAGCFAWTDSSGKLRMWGFGMKFLGHRDFLDSPGEFWLDTVNQILYLQPLPGHAEILLTTFTTEQVPFNLISNSLAMIEHGYNSIPTVICQTGSLGPAGIFSAAPGYYSIHDIEIGYSADGVNIEKAVNLEVYNMHIHDIHNQAVTVVATTNVVVYNNVISGTTACIQVGASVNPFTEFAYVADNVMIYNNSCQYMGMTWGTYYAAGISIQGAFSQWTILRGNYISDSGGNSDDNPGINTCDPSCLGPFVNQQIAEYNVMNRLNLIFGDGGPFFTNGLIRYNQVFNTGTNGMAMTPGGGGHGDGGLGDDIYAQSGATNVTAYYNLFVNDTGACYNIGGFFTNTLWHNLCIDFYQNDVNPIQYSNSDTTLEQGQVISMWNNWVFWLNPMWDNSIAPFDLPYQPPIYEWFSVDADNYWCDLNSDCGGPYSYIDWCPRNTHNFAPYYGNAFCFTPPWPLFNRSLFCNGFMTGPANGVLDLDPIISQYGSADPTLLYALRASAWASEQSWAQTTDQLPGGIQYGNENCRNIAADATTDLLAYIATQRAATEQSFLNQMFGPLEWYSVP
jgi:hypothetical protein